MAQDITCPNCGGLIFSDDASAMELSPCTCTGANQPVEEPAAKQSVAAAAMASTRSTPPARPSSKSSSDSPKVCCNCGNDVSGRKRLKDSRGRYWCPTCAKKDERRKKVRQEQTKTACTSCGTEVEVQNMLAYDGQFVCPKCYRDKKDAEKAADARISRINNAYKGTETKRMWPYYVVLGILAAIILARKLHLI